MPLAEPPGPQLDVTLSAPTGARVSLVESLLAEQKELSVVARFAQQHAAHQPHPAQARYYRDLIPLSAPADDQQYGFTVDLDACSGCKACVTACHSLNGLDDDETFRDVGLLMGRDGRGQHVLQHVTTACHHCLEPACLYGCPTRAYDKDPVTGIVRHLDDQCIGCQYCTLMCPYDVPKYNPAKGIVRKCDMCRQRLDDGEAPACVQACPNQAIRIELISRDSAVRQATAGSFLPTAPNPRLTIPTTRFVSGREQLHDVAGPDEPLKPAHVHWPLVLMLVLTQMSIGLFAFSPLATEQSIVFIAGVIGLAGLAVAVFHLGRPQIAYRAWLGWRTSWLSREIIALAIWSLAAGGFVGAELVDAGPAMRWLLWSLTSINGALAIFCSALVYVATRREFWSAGRTIPRFAITALILGSAGTAAALAQAGQHPPTALIGLLIAAVAARLMCDAPSYRLREGEATELDRSADLLMRSLSGWNHLQVTLAILAGVFMPLCWFGLPQLASAMALPAALLLVAAEIIQRALFFAAVSPPRMPGVPHA